MILLNSFHHVYSIWGIEIQPVIGDDSIQWYIQCSMHLWH